MNSVPDEPTEELLADLLVAAEEARRQGRASAAGDVVPGQVRRDQAFLQALRQARPAAPGDTDSLLNLVCQEIHLRKQLGNAPNVEEYVERFPHLAGPLRTRLGGSNEVRPLPQVAGFETIRELGRGGMGVVYLARQVRLNRLVALKMIKDERLGDDGQRRRFLVEAETVARLSHPHIVQVYESGVSEGLHYFALEYVEGSTLAEVLAEQPLAPSDTAALVETLARAIHVAHEAGVVHRDLKPGNVLLAACGVANSRSATPQAAKIADFGLAKRLDVATEQTQSGVLVGTPAYMAPEQARGDRAEVGPPTDVYALGVILYECLTGRVPFKGPTGWDTLQQALHEEPIAPSRLIRQVPRDLETICLKCLDKAPPQRYPSALALAEDLRRFGAGEPIQARPTSAWERARKWARRRPTLAVLLLVSVVAVLALGGAVTGSIYNTWLRDALDRAESAQQAESAARRQAEQFQYFYHIALAHGGWRDGNLGQVRTLLDGCPPDQRQWEWHYLQRLCRSELFTLTGHRGWVEAVTFSPDGTRLASAGGGGTVLVHDVATGRALLTLRPPLGRVHATAYSPDGKHLAVSGEGKGITIWDAADGRLMRTLAPDEQTVFQVAFSPDGARLATAHPDRSVRVWEVATGREVLCLRGHEDLNDVNGVAFSPNGRRIVSGAQDGTVRLWDAVTGRAVAVLRGHTGWIIDVAFSPCGNRLASASSDRTVRVWDAATGREVLSLSGHASEVDAVAFSPDGALLASGSADQTVRLWDAVTGRQVGVRKGHTNAVKSVAFSPSGAWIASGSKDGTVKVWETVLEQDAQTLQSHAGLVWAVAVSPDGARFASAGNDRVVRLWDATSGQLAQTLIGHTQGVFGLAFSPDGRQLASASSDRTVRLWDVASGETIRTFSGHAEVVWAVAFSPNGDRIATASHDRTAKVWDVDSGREEFTLTGHEGRVLCVAFSPDGSQLVTAGDGGELRLWETATGKPTATWRGHTDGVEGVAWHRSGRLASASYDQTVKVWDAASGTVVTTLQGHTWPVTGVAFSPDGARLASASGDGAVKVWDVAVGREAITLRGHAQRVQAVAFSSEGWLLSGSHDGTIKVWDGRPGEPEVGEREARGLLEFLLTRPLCQADVAEVVRHSPTATPQGRQKALTLVQGCRAEADPERSYRAGWALVCQPYLNAIQYGLALRQANAACRLAPEQGRYLTLRGAALYRLGEDREAVTVLRQADQLNKGRPADLAFLALAQHRLGRREDYRGVVERLRELAATDTWSGNEEVQALLREAAGVEQPSKSP